MSKIIMSDELPNVCASVKDLGYEIIGTDSVKCFLPFERRHADMQCLVIDNTVFVLKEAVNLINSLKENGISYIMTERETEGKYPRNVLLNAVYLNGRLYCREDAADPAVKNYCATQGIQIINVNQGYAKCSVLLADKVFITADKGIYDAMTRNGEEGLLIESGDIDLKGVDYGFIGGCGFYDDGTLYLNGDISKHKSYLKIKEFLTKKDIKTVCLSENKLYDIGGFIVI